MVPWLLQHLSPFAEQLVQHTAGDSRVNVTARVAIAALTSFLVALCLGPLAIRWLTSRFRERIDSASDRLNELHAGKQGTPTMGGLLIIAAVVISTLVWADLTNSYVQLSLFVSLTFLILGGTDDWIKVKTRRRGLTSRQKFLVQSLLAGVSMFWLYQVQRSVPQGLELIFPIGSLSISLGVWLIPWGAFVMVGTSNGVNLTDGLDGLATGCALFAGAALVAVCYLAGHHQLAEYLKIPFVPGSGELAIVMSSLVGALLGFLWFNCHPAQVFMGDAGSLPIGALLALSALVTRQECLLVIVGGIFVIETLSVIAQVTSRRLTGKRILACSPLHNHFVFRGVHETKIVTRFWICSALLAVLGVMILKLQ